MAVVLFCRAHWMLSHVKEPKQVSKYEWALPKEAAAFVRGDLMKQYLCPSSWADVFQEKSANQHLLLIPASHSLST